MSISVYEALCIFRGYLIGKGKREWKDKRIMRDRRDILSSMYQFPGSSTRVFLCGGSGFGRGCIHVLAERCGEKSIAVMGGLYLGRK